MRGEMNGWAIIRQLAWLQDHGDLPGSAVTPQLRDSLALWVPQCPPFKHTHIRSGRGSIIHKTYKPQLAKLAKDHPASN